MLKKIIAKQKRLIIVCLLLLCALPASAKIYVIVNKANPVGSIGISTLKRVYLGKYVSVPSMSAAYYPVDLSAHSPVRKAFISRVIRMSSSLLMQYRSRLIFSGKGRVPVSVGSQGQVVSIVARKANAIGYVSSPPRSAKVKVVLTL